MASLSNSTLRLRRKKLSKISPNRKWISQRLSVSGLAMTNQISAILLPIDPSVLAKFPKQGRYKESLASRFRFFSCHFLSSCHGCQHLQVLQVTSPSDPPPEFQGTCHIEKLLILVITICALLPLCNRLLLVMAYPTIPTYLPDRLLQTFPRSQYISRPPST